jgi:co-chaperonin GroES (HSP10)
MVWQGVTEIGCATNSIGINVCRYRSGDTLSRNTANMAGAYEEMVLPPSKSLEVCIAEVEGGQSAAPGASPVTSITDNSLAPAPANSSTVTTNSSTATPTNSSTATMTNSSMASSTSGPPGAIRVGDTIWLRGHTGRRLTVEGTEVHGKWFDRLSWQALVIEKASSDVTSDMTIKSGDAIYLRAHTGNHVAVENTTVHAKWDDMGSWQRLIIEKEGGGPIYPSDSISLSAHTGKRIAFEDDDTTVSAKWQARSWTRSWQALIIESDDAAARAAGATTNTTAPSTGNMTSGTPGAIHVGDHIYLRAHTGMRLTVQEAEVHGKWDDRLSWQALIIEKRSPAGSNVTVPVTVHSGDAIYLRAHTGNHVAVENTTVHAKWDDMGAWQRLIIEKQGGTGSPIYPNDTVYLRAHTGMRIAFEDDYTTVSAKWDHMGSWQALVIESDDAAARVAAQAAAASATRGSAAAAVVAMPAAASDIRAEMLGGPRMV